MFVKADRWSLKLVAVRASLCMGSGVPIGVSVVPSDMVLIGRIVSWVPGTNKL